MQASVFGWARRLKKPLLLATLAFLPACALFSSSKSLPAKGSKEARAAARAEEKALRAGEKAPNLARPRRAAGETLRAWLATRESRLSIQRIDDCQAQMIAFSEKGKSPIELKALARQLKNDIATNIELHHYCFYYMLMRLEMKLEQNSLGNGYQDRLVVFNRESKALWVLAMALDASVSDTYYRYVARKRYIALSQLYFGRNLLPAKGTLEPEDDPEAVDPGESESPDDDDDGGGDDDQEDGVEAPAAAS